MAKASGPSSVAGSVLDDNQQGSQDLHLSIERIELDAEIRRQTLEPGNERVRAKLLTFLGTLPASGNAAYIECLSLALSTDGMVKTNLSVLPGTPLRDADAPVVRELLLAALKAIESKHLEEMSEIHRRVADLPKRANSKEPGEDREEFERIQKDLLSRYMVTFFPAKYRRLCIGKDAQGIEEADEALLNRGETPSNSVLKARRRVVNLMLCANLLHAKEDRMKVVRDRINKDAVEKEMDEQSRKPFFQADMAQLRLLFLRRAFPEEMQAAESGTAEALGLSCCRAFLTSGNLCDLRDLNEGGDEKKARLRAILNDFALVLSRLSKLLSERFEHAARTLLMGLAIDEEALGRALTADPEKTSKLLEAAVMRGTGHEVPEAMRLILREYAQKLVDSPCKPASIILSDMGKIAAAACGVPPSAAFEQVHKHFVEGALEAASKVYPHLATKPTWHHLEGSEGGNEKNKFLGHVFEHMHMMGVEMAKKRYNVQATLHEGDGKQMAGKSIAAPEYTDLIVEAADGKLAAFQFKFTDGPNFEARVAEWFKKWQTKGDHDHPGLALDEVTVVGPHGRTPAGGEVKLKGGRSVKATASPEVFDGVRVQAETPEAMHEFMDKNFAHLKDFVEMNELKKELAKLVEERDKWQGRVDKMPEGKGARAKETLANLKTRCGEVEEKLNALKKKPRDYDTDMLQLGVTDAQIWWQKTKAVCGSVLRLGAWALGVGMAFLTGLPQKDNVLGWISVAGGWFHSLCDLPMCIADVLEGLGKVLEKAWSKLDWSQSAQGLLLNAARVASVVAVLLSVVSFVRAALDLGDAIREGRSAGQIALKVFGLVSAGLGLAASVICCIASFKAGSLAALASSSLGPVGVALGLLALSIGLLVGGISMLCPAEEDSFASYMAEEWDGAWSSTGDWPSHWDLMTHGERALAVGQIVIGGVELSDDRVTRKAHKHRPGPLMEDYIEAFLAQCMLRQASESEPARLGTGQLRAALQGLRGALADGGGAPLIVNLGLLRPGADCVFAGEGGRGERLVCSQGAHGGLYLLAAQPEDVMCDKLLCDVLPYLERALRAGTLREPPSFPSLAYKACPDRAALPGHVLLAPVLPGSVTCAVASREDAAAAYSRTTPLVSGFAVLGRDGSIGSKVDVTLRPYYESDVTAEGGGGNGAQQAAWPPCFAHLVGASLLDAGAVCFDLSQMLEFQERLPEVSAVIFHERRGALFVCDPGRPPLFQTARVQDFALLAKLVYFQPARFAALSLDPDDPNWDTMSPSQAVAKADDGQLHYKKRVWPRWLQGSSVCEKLFAADYSLKESVFEGFGDTGGLPGALGRWTRVWLACKSSSVMWREVRGADCVALTGVDLEVACEARLISGDGHGGMQDVAVDERQVEWARSVTRELSLAQAPGAETPRWLQELADVYRLREVIVAMKQHGMPVSYTAVEAACLPEGRTSSHVPGRAFRALTRMAVGGCELLSSLRPRRVRLQEDEESWAWLGGLLRRRPVEPRPEFLSLRQGRGDPPACAGAGVGGPDVALLQSPFATLDWRQSHECARCRRQLAAVNPLHSVFQDLHGRRVCDRLTCVSTSRTLTGGCVLLSAEPPPCSFCFERIEDPRDDTAAAADDDGGMRTLLSDTAPMRAFHARCFERWPGRSDSDQERLATAAEAEVRAARDGLQQGPLDAQGFVAAFLGDLARRGAGRDAVRSLAAVVAHYLEAEAELRQDMINPDTSPVTVALLGREADALDVLLSGGAEAEEAALMRPSLEAMSQALFRRPLEVFLDGAARRRVQPLDAVEEARSCLLCDADLQHRLSVQPRVLAEALEDPAAPDGTDALRPHLCVPCAVKNGALEAPGDCLASVAWVHKGIICDGCDTPLLRGPRFTSRDKLRDVDFCELCYCSGRFDEQLPNMVVIDGPRCDGVERLASWRVAVVRLAAAVLTALKELTESREVQHLSANAQQAAAGHAKVAAAVQEAAEAQLAAQQKAARLSSPGSDQREWLELDFARAAAEAWASLRGRLELRAQELRGEAESAQRQLEGDLQRQEAIASSVADVRTVQELFEQQESLAEEAALRQMQTEEQLKEALERLSGAQRRARTEFQRNLRVRPVVLCPAVDPEHACCLLEAEFTVHLHLQDAAACPVTLPGAEWLRTQGLALTPFCDPGELGDLQADDVAVILIDVSHPSGGARLVEATSAAAERLALGTAALGGPAVIVISPGQCGSAGATAAMPLAAGMKGMAPAPGFLGLWPLPCGGTLRIEQAAAAASAAVSSPPRVAVQLGSAILDCPVEGHSAEEGQRLHIHVPKMRPETWELRLVEDGDECAVELTVRSASTLVLPAQGWLLRECRDAREAPAKKRWPEGAVLPRSLRDRPAAVVASFNEALAMCQGLTLTTVHSVQQAAYAFAAADREGALRARAEQAASHLEVALAEAAADCEGAEAELRSRKSWLVQAERDTLRCNALHRERAVRLLERASRAAAEPGETAAREEPIEEALGRLTEDLASLEEALRCLDDGSQPWPGPTACPSVADP